MQSGVTIVPEYGVTPKTTNSDCESKIIFNYDSKHDAGP